MALLLPAPAAKAHVIEVAMCNGGTQRIVLPQKGVPEPSEDPHGCCRKACHAGSDRRKKSGLVAENCC